MAAIAVALAVFFTRGKNGSESKTESVAAARDLARRVVLAPTDWGSKFTKGDPYENEDLTEQIVDQDCKYVTQPIIDALASLQRNAKTSDDTVYSNSQLIFYRNSGAAEAHIARFRDGTQRCRTEVYSDNKTRWSDIHEVQVPELKGFDDVAAEEGHQVTDEKGQKADNYYTYLSGRKDNFLTEAVVIRSGTQVQNRSDAVNALSLMLSRL